MQVPMNRTTRPDLVWAAALLLPALAFGWVVVGLQILPHGEGWGYDFQAYRDAAVRLVETGTPYVSRTVEGPWRPGPSPYFLYPPPAGVALIPSAWLAPGTGALVWHVLHVVVVGLACAVLPVQARVRWAVLGAALLSQAVTSDVSLGNVSSLLLLPLALAWRWLDRPAGAIAQAVAISARPSLGVIVIWQVLRRRWRAVGWTLAAGVVMVLVSLPVVGVAAYADYLTLMRGMSDALGVRNNLDLGSTAAALGADEQTAGLALAGGYVVAAGAVVIGLRRDREVGFVVATNASMLLAPVLWGHYLALVVLPAALLVSRGRPWGLLLPFLTWAPAIAQPFVVLLAILIPFLAGPVRGDDVAPGGDMDATAVHEVRDPQPA
jgi:hypothetical protein